MDRFYFSYGEEATEYLKSRDKKLAKAIERIGHIHRPADPDLFRAVVHSIVDQQISSAAAKTVRARLKGMLGELTPETICSVSAEQLQSCGMSFRKAEYIMDFALKTESGEFDLHNLPGLSDGEIIEKLSALKGIGVWTAQMIMIFCLQRPDVVSFGDLAIIRGMRMLYRHRKVDRKLFDRYARRYSPFGSVASLYLWAISAGALPELSDPAPKKK